MSEGSRCRGFPPGLGMMRRSTRSPMILTTQLNPLDTSYEALSDILFDRTYLGSDHSDGSLKSSADSPFSQVKHIPPAPLSITPHNAIDKRQWGRIISTRK
jgi:hypothetical protein